MIESQNIRQILAIMVTDIVNYTETMNDNEDKAWEYLKKQRNIIKPTVSKMNGQMFKEMGDGTFSKFRSAIEAVKCAVKIQEEAHLNDLPLRIAVHLGDVMDDGIDVIGMGVNIASRIQQLADPGNIVVSDDVWRQVRGQSDMEGRSIGEQDIKGYHKSVEVYELTYNPDGSVTQKVKVTETVTIIDEEGKKIKSEKALQKEIKKVVVFPFDYNGENEDMEWIQYGIPFGCCISLLQDDVIELQFPNDRELGFWRFLRELEDVDYKKGFNVPLTLKKKIAKQLYADYFISGNINDEKNYNVVTKLYKTENGQLVNEIIQTDSNIYNIMDNFSLFYRKEMGVPLSHIQSNTNLPSSELLTDSQKAYEEFIKGIIYRIYENNNDLSIQHFQKAIKIDSGFCLGACGLFNTCEMTNNEKYQEIKSNAIKLALNHIYKVPTRLQFRIKIGNYMWHVGQPEKARKVAEMWLKQYPNCLDPYYELAHVLWMETKHNEAIQVYKDIIEKDPTSYRAYEHIINIYNGRLGQHDKAIKYAERYMEACPKQAHSYSLLANIYYGMGNYDLSKDYFEQAFMLASNNSNYLCGIAKCEINSENNSAAEEQLEEALELCKSPINYIWVYNLMKRCKKNKGQIKESIEFSKLCEKYQKILHDESFAILLKMNKLEDYVLIGQLSAALEELDELKKELIHPYSLWVGVGSLFIGAYAGIKEPIEEALSKIDELFKIKDYKFLGDIKYWAHAILCHFDEKPDQAIEYINKAIEVDRQWRQDRNYWLMRCYNQKNVNQAIQEGEIFLKKPPFDPLIILELSKAYIANGQIENANQNLTKLLGIWEDADEEYIYFQEAKKLWKEINTEKELA